MDPHSTHNRHSQFNKRQPRSSPNTPSSRFMEAPVKPTLNYLPKRPSPSTKASSSSRDPSLTPRRIATNSRVKQDEKYRKDMYLAFVNNALEQKTNGNTDAFDELVQQFRPRSNVPEGGPPPAQLRLWILALSHVVSRLERPHTPLVEAIVGMPWVTMDSTTVKSYTSFMGMLLSARPEYLSIVLTKIAHGFTYQSGLQALDVGQPESSSNPLTRRVVYDRLHYLLHHLLSLIPTLPNTLHPLLVRNFPHKRQSVAAQTTYIRNLLRVAEYCPELSDRILATLVDRALQIDVEIQVELEELEDNEDYQDQGGVFELDPFDTVVGQGSESDSDDDESDDGAGDDFSDLSSDAGDMDDVAQAPDVHTDVLHIQDMVHKLDAMLKLIFDHFHSAHAATATAIVSASLSSDPPTPTLTPTPSTPTLPLSRSPPSLSIEEGKERRRAQFAALLHLFDRAILRTFRSRYTQFLLFWYASLDPEFADVFQGMLVAAALLDTDRPPVTRAAAAAYIASFVSRARFVGRDGARQVVGVLCEFLRVHLDAVDAVGVGAGANAAHHEIFYAVAQAVFLVFCFRWRDLLEESEGEDQDQLDEPGAGKKWMPALGVMQRVVTSSLNPLKVCSPNVVHQFARVAHLTGFVYTYSIIESNRRSDDGSGGKGVGPAVLGAQLHTFFPFDPYKLPRSGAYIQGIYREWESVAIEDGDEDEEEDDDDDEGDEGERDERDDDWKSAAGRAISMSSVPGKQSDETGGLGVSFEGMSISPTRPAGLLSMSQT